MQRWCDVCGTDHPGRRCPGELVAAGPEMDGWKVAVQTPRGMEGYGVLLAEVTEGWRARVVTYPNVLWSVPGGETTMKFHGRSAEEAERKAMTFIRGHCADRGYTLRDALELFDLPTPGVKQGGRVLAPRCTRILPVKFGLSRPTIFGRTGNLSATGLFVNTQEPLLEGRLAGLMLELEHCRLPLRGEVMWKREYPAPSRPAGMGLELMQPPETYVRYVEALMV